MRVTPRSTTRAGGIPHGKSSGDATRDGEQPRDEQRKYSRVIILNYISASSPHICGFYVAYASISAALLCCARCFFYCACPGRSNPQYVGTFCGCDSPEGPGSPIARHAGRAAAFGQPISSSRGGRRRGDGGC